MIVGVALRGRLHVSRKLAREVGRRGPQRRAYSARKAMIGAALALSKARLAMEYNVAKVNSLSFKIGVGI
jgi:hypothetical protein